MHHAAGADVRAAIAEIEQAGWSVKRLAGDLGVHASTAYRWRSGRRTPNKANFAALVQLAEMEYAAENCRRGTRGVVLIHLQRAFELLETDQDRAEAEKLAARMTAAFAAREEQRQAEQAERDARAAAIRAEVAPRHPNSVIYKLRSPFDAIPQPAPLPF